MEYLHLHFILFRRTIVLVIQIRIVNLAQILPNEESCNVE
jgi:hypothetical protein